MYISSISMLSVSSILLLCNNEYTKFKTHQTECGQLYNFISSYYYQYYPFNQLIPLLHLPPQPLLIDVAYEALSAIALPNDALQPPQLCLSQPYLLMKAVETCRRRINSRCHCLREQPNYCPKQLMPPNQVPSDLMV